VDKWCAVALIVAMVFTTGYSLQRIFAAVREKRDALAVFGRQVVKEAARHGWRYAVVGGEEEGMLLYVRQTEFLEPDRAATDWNSGKLNALVVPDDEMEGLIPRLRGGEPKRLLTSSPAGRDRKRYFLLERPGSP
jgi:hypothetical protein